MLQTVSSFIFFKDTSLEVAPHLHSETVLDCLQQDLLDLMPTEFCAESKMGILHSLPYLYLFHLSFDYSLRMFAPSVYIVILGCHVCLMIRTSSAGLSNIWHTSACEVSRSNCQEKSFHSTKNGMALGGQKRMQILPTSSKH